MIYVDVPFEDFFYGILASSVGPVLVLRRGKRLFAFMEVGREVVIFRTRIPRRIPESIADALLSSRYIYLDEEGRIVSSDAPPRAAHSYIVIMHVRRVEIHGHRCPHEKDG